MRDWNELPPYARQVVNALLGTEILRKELSGYDKTGTASQIAIGGRATPLRFDGKSVIARVWGTKVDIYLVLKDEKVHATEFIPAVDVKLARPAGNEKAMSDTFLALGIEEFEPRLKPKPETDAILGVKLADAVDESRISDLLPWYVTWTTRAIIGSRAYCKQLDRGLFLLGDTE